MSCMENYVCSENTIRYSESYLTGTRYHPKQSKRVAPFVHWLYGCSGRTAALLNSIAGCGSRGANCMVHGIQYAFAAVTNSEAHDCTMRHPRSLAGLSLRLLDEVKVWFLPVTGNFDCAWNIGPQKKCRR